MQIKLGPFRPQGANTQNAPRRGTKLTTWMPATSPSPAKSSCRRPVLDMSVKRPRIFGATPMSKPV
eukprot:9647644-Lingulodinium_polyedra.AAC.1